MIRLFRTQPFATVWAVGFFQEAAFFLLVNVPGRFLEMGITEGRIGLAYSASAVAALILRPWFGRILDVVHRRSVLRVAGMCHVVAIVVLGSAVGPGPVMWGAFLTQRVMQIVLMTTLLTYAADAVPKENRTEGLAIYGLSGLVPIALSNLVGETLFAAGDYSSLLILAALVGSVSWLLVWRLPLLPVVGARPRRHFWAVVGQRDMLPLWWVTFVFGMGLQTVFVFMRTYIDTRKIGTLGLFFVVYGGVAIAARAGGGARYDRMSSRPVIVAATLLQALGLVAIAAATNAGLLLAGAALTGLAHGTIFPLLSSQVVNRARTAERGSAIAAFTSIVDIALLVIGPVVGIGIDLSGYGPTFTAEAAFLVAGALVYRVWDRRLQMAPVP